ncbi:translation repressor/antiviral protein Ski3 [Penicillium argentinense]|uniref:Translation repressor/antiviral protein Ski3 n=1 Tax=Penicillium argentinense TaxID=1131581 RepID=A0A9W9G447_9EURO|nr:translation repressor/antiviral protein Ski3 [Penicillium argentinense]KAJ5111275.1 translation repressor/antiviral protein Ski3 [Penicillium argentinense]
MSKNAALKAVRAAIDSKDYDTAVGKAKVLVQEDPGNYHAHVFLGLAYDKLNQNDEAEQTYLAATRIKPDDRTAWQGLIAVYQKQGASKLNAWHDAAFKLATIFANLEDSAPARCAEVIEKYTNVARSRGSPAQYKRALLYSLPTCPLYGVLEGRVPHPSHTYLRLIEITEAEEKEYINREIGERRTRLGARIDLVTLEVKREAFKQTQLEQLYQGIIDWTNDDEVRRQYEERLLQRACDELEVMPHKKRNTKRREILRSAQGMVVIKHPFKLAWEIVLEWQDVQTYSQWDVGVLREYIEFFPEDGLAKVLKGFLLSDLSPFPKENPDEDKQAKDSDITDLAALDPMILMVDGLDHAPTSAIAHRIMADLYHSAGEYQVAIDVARKGLESIIPDLVGRTGVNLANTTDSLKINLANSLIHHQSPRHHSEAKGVFEEILGRKPSSTVCLLGIGLILQDDKDYKNAVEFLRRALARDPTDIKIRGELYWCIALDGDLVTGRAGLEAALESLMKEQPESRSFKAVLLYRIGYCLWELDPSPAARKARNGAYAYFLGSINADMNYAPAYSSLGFYFADYKKDKTRARRSFHKAFELSTSEIPAAERLAKGFADQQEWDLVEAISQRVVDSGNAQPAPSSKRPGYSWPYAALGAVQINRQQYDKSAVSFQCALRLAREDYHCWVGLAESYHHAGRFVAATKAFEEARKHESRLSEAEKEHIWSARYMLANVKTDLGEYGDAIALYEEILASRPADIGVTTALLQTLAESSWKSLDSGLFHDAAELASKVINVSSSIVKIRSDLFNLWKAVGDACINFSYIGKEIGMLPISECRALLASGANDGELDIMSEVDKIGHSYLDSSENEAIQSSDCTYLAILAFKRAIHVASGDQLAQSVAWYNLGCAEYRAYRTSLASPDVIKKPRRFLKTAMQCFKKAIELEAGNAEFWNALGVATMSMSAKVAQHAFARSLHLNEKGAEAWTNLGALYLIHNDIQLANDAFTRAQSTDPDYSPAWVGQGLLALLYGDKKEARGLFAHAFDISSSSDTISKRQYTLTLFDHLVSDLSASNEVAQLIQPCFALQQLCAQDPSDLPIMHMSALLGERMGETSDAEANLQAVCSGMEAEFESSESPSALSRFAQANADIARVLLARQDYEQAAEKAETALTLSEEQDAIDFDPEACEKMRLSAHLTAGLAYYFIQSMDQAIDMFRDALNESDHAPDVVCLLAQVLWAKGGEEERSVARQQLFDCIETHPEHVGAVSLLGAIAIMDRDNDAVEAVESDLRTMVTRDDIDIRERARILKLLTAISAMGFTEDVSLPEDVRRLGEATAAVMLSPGQPSGWMELSATSGEPYASAMSVKRALHCVPPHGKLEASDLSQAYTQTGNTGDALRATMIAPWKREAWESVNYVQSN